MLDIKISLLFFVPVYTLSPPRSQSGLHSCYLGATFHAVSNGLNVVLNPLCLVYPLGILMSALLAVQQHASLHACSE
jgi:hypothetical protein